MANDKDMDVRRRDVKPHPREYVSADRFSTHHREPTKVPKIDEVKPVGRVAVHDDAIKNAPAKNPKLQSAEPRTQPKQAKTVNRPKTQKSFVLERKSTRRKIMDNVGPVFQLRSRKSILLWSIVLILIGTLGFAFAGRWRTNNLVKSEPPATTNPATKSLSEEAVSQTTIDNHIVAADEPRLLIIQKIGVQTIVQKKAGEAGKLPPNPDNTNAVAWDDKSAKPGSPGVVLVTGYINGPTQAGVFYSLGTMQTGDIVTLQKGDGKLMSYKVVAVKQYDVDKVPVAEVASVYPGATKGLNLLTAGERFDVNANKFENKVVVYTVQQ